MTTDDYNRIISELMDELPQDFFRKLNGGVIVSDSVMVPDYAKADDLYAMGQYLVYSGIRQIVMYKGSFDRLLEVYSIRIRLRQRMTEKKRNISVVTLQTPHINRRHCNE